MCTKRWKYRENYADPTVQSEQQVTTATQVVRRQKVTQPSRYRKLGNKPLKDALWKTVSFKDHQVPYLEIDFFFLKKEIFY